MRCTGNIINEYLININIYKLYNFFKISLSIHIYMTLYDLKLCSDNLICKQLYLMHKGFQRAKY